MIQSKIITDKNTWEHFLLSQKMPPFLQSWNMGQVHEQMGESIVRLGFYDSTEELVGIAFCIVVRARRGSYLYLPYGPILKSWDQNIFKQVISKIKEVAQEHKCSSIKISPFIDDTSDNRKLFASEKFISAPLHILGESLWILDIQKNENELMYGMKKNHRNLIRRAQKDGVKIHVYQDESGMSAFLKLHEQTRKRHNFVPYPDDYFQHQVEKFKDDGQVLMLEARHDGKVLASAIIMYYGDTASYHHGASIPSKIPATYLLQWTAIQEAKKRGMKYYNFWGIYTGENKKHPFYGISHFKRGFGGQLKQLLHCQDLPLKPGYALTWAIDTVRKYKRGFND